MQGPTPPPPPLGDAKEVEEMCQKEVPGEHLKGGLTVEGIELRPKKMVKV